MFSVPDGRAANHPLAVTTFKPPMAALLPGRSEEHTSELQSPCNLVCRLLLEKKKLDIELISAGPDVIRRAEDRELFRETVRLAGLKVPESTIVTDPADLPIVLSFHVILRPDFTLGGHGGGTARSLSELEGLLERALAESPVRQVLVEESLLGWDEVELEVIRDRRDNVVIVCSVENLDPMGRPTCDSVTVAPQME